MDFPVLYKGYCWKSDTWNNEFPGIQNLERSISEAIRSGTLSLPHLIAVAKWGGLPNIGRIKAESPIKLPLYREGRLDEWVRKGPENVIRILEGQIRGFGPTYTSKVLRFAAPEIFGAIDTRIVRVFGKNRTCLGKNYLLDLKATPVDGRWAILSGQSGWPGEYGSWIKVLTYISTHLNENCIHCPHPGIFEKSGLRSGGNWLNADVEMALFNYATRTIRKLGA